MPNGSSLSTSCAASPAAARPPANDAATPGCLTRFFRSVGQSLSRLWDGLADLGRHNFSLADARATVAPPRPGAAAAGAMPAGSPSTAGLALLQATPSPATGFASAGASGSAPCTPPRTLPSAAGAETLAVAGRPSAFSPQPFPGLDHECDGDPSGVEPTRMHPSPARSGPDHDALAAASRYFSATQVSPDTAGASIFRAPPAAGSPARKDFDRVKSHVRALCQPAMTSLFSQVVCDATAAIQARQASSPRSFPVVGSRVPLSARDKEMILLQTFQRVLFGETPRFEERVSPQAQTFLTSLRGVVNEQWGSHAADSADFLVQNLLVGMCFSQFAAGEALPPDIPGRDGKAAPVMAKAQLQKELVTTTSKLITSLMQTTPYKPQSAQSPGATAVDERVALVQAMRAQYRASMAVLSPPLAPAPAASHASAAASSSSANPPVSWSSSSTSSLSSVSAPLHPQTS